MFRGKFSSIEKLEIWLDQVLNWQAKRGIFIVIGKSQTGKTHTVKGWAAKHNIPHVMVSAALLELAFPQDGPKELHELAAPANRKYTAELLKTAFYGLLEQQQAPVVVLDHWDILMDYDVPIEPQSVLGERSAKTGQKFILVSPGYERKEIFYLQNGRDRYHWRRFEAQFQDQYFYLEEQ